MKHTFFALVLLCLHSTPAWTQLQNSGASLKIATGTTLKAANGVSNTNAGTLTVEGSLSTPGNLVNTGAATLQGNGRYRVGGNWTNSGTFAAGTSTVIFDGSQNSSVSAGGAPFYQLALDKSSGYHLLPTAYLEVTGTLDFRASGNQVVLGGYNLRAGEIKDYSPSSFIRTAGAGSLLRTVGTGPVVFPVGDTAYNPVVLTNAGTADLYHVRVADTLLSNGSSGSAYAAHAVDRTWFVEESVPGESDLSLDLQWNGHEELPGFDRTKAYISQFGGDTWDHQPPAGAAGADPYTLSRSGVSSLSPFAVVDGKFRPRIRLRGRVVWKGDGHKGVKNTIVTVRGDAEGTALCDADGNYDLTLAGNGNLSIVPAKEDDLLNGITVGDALAIEQHLKGINTVIDPYTLIAMDIDRNDTLSAFDSPLINQLLLNDPEAANYFNQSWRFVPQNHSLSVPPWGFPEQIDLTDVTDDQSDQNFYGVKVGDVAEVFADPLDFRSGGSMEPLVWRIEDQMLEAGQDMQVTFTADFHENIAAFQFGLRFAPQYLQLEDVDQLPALPLGDEHFGLFEAHLGEFRAVWAHHEGFALPHGTTTFHLHFSVLQSGVKLSEVLGLDEDLLPGLAYNRQLDNNVVQLHFTPVTAIKDPVRDVSLFENWPNPFLQTTQLRFYLPESCRAGIRVLEESGRELWRQEKTYPAGYTVEPLRLDGISASGVLIGELVTPYGTRTIKLLRIDN